MKPDRTPRRTPRRHSNARFFITALLIAIAIFVIIKLVQNGMRSRPPAQHQQVTSSATAAISAASDSLKGFEVVLWRKGCTAGCPDYALHYADGKLQYTGIRDVRKKGNLSVDFDSYHQHQLLKLVERATFFGVGDNYTLKSRKCHPTRTDAAVYVVGVKLNGETKKVKVNEGCTNIPPQLTRLARGIDKLARSSRWTGIIKAPANVTEHGGLK